MSTIATRRAHLATTVAVAAFLPFAACSTREPGPAASPGLSDAGDAAAFGEFSIATTMSPVIPTVATVTWSIAGVGQLESARIEFGAPGASRWMTAPVPLDSGAPYSTLLVGMKPSSAYRFRIVVETASGSAVSPEHDIATGNLPQGLPEVTVQAVAPDRHARGFVLSTLFAAPVGAVILDADGDFVWWYPRTPALGKMLLGRARMSPDGQWVVMWGVNSASAGVVGTEDPDAGSPEQKLLKVRLDGSDEQVVPLPYGHHDFTILPDGTVAYIEYDTRVVDGTAVAGDRLMELRSDGSTVEVYSVWNDFEYDGTVPAAGEGWCHANFLDYHADSGIYELGSKGFSAILRIERATGKLLGVIGGSESNYTVASGGTTPYEDQHGFQREGSTLLVFDNGPKERMSSRAVQYDIDEASSVLTLTWSYTPEPALFNFSMGNALLLPGGNRLVTFSTSGQIDEVDPAGALVWRLNMGLGGALGYAVWKESLYE